MIHAERKLFSYYFVSSLLAVFVIVTFSVPWGHWSYTLDRCVKESCGCILYGKSYHDLFAGGQDEYCRFVTFSQIPLFVICVALTFYHGIRAYIKPRREARKALWRGNPLLSGSRRRKSAADTNLAEYELEPPSKCGVVSLVVTSFVCLALLLTVLGFFIDGYLRTCNEYRHTLVKYLAATGRISYVLNNRLICSSIFDFMDYLQPDRRFPEDPYENGRRDRINTGLSLLLAMLALCVNVLVWIGIFVNNFRLLFEKLRNRKD